MRRFAIVDELVSTFGASAEFRPLEFVCWSYPPFVIDGTWRGSGIIRELRCNSAGASSVVRAHERGSAWLRTVIVAMVRAGYERVSSSSETTLRRWLHGSRALTHELDFLDALGVDASPRRWPRRQPTGEPLRPRSQPRRWLDAIKAAQDCRIHWHEWVAIFNRRGVLGDGESTFSVDVLGGEVWALPRWIDVVVSAKTSDPTLLRAVRRLFRERGFNGGKPAQAWFGIKRVRTVAAAHRESQWMSERLVSVGRP